MYLGKTLFYMKLKFQRIFFMFLLVINIKKIKYNFQSLLLKLNFLTKIQF